MFTKHRPFHLYDKTSLALGILLVKQITSLQSLIGTIPTTASLIGMIPLQLEILWVRCIQRFPLLLFCYFEKMACHSRKRRDIQAQEGNSCTWPRVSSYPKLGLALVFYCKDCVHHSRFYNVRILALAFPTG